MRDPPRLVAGIKNGEGARKGLAPRHQRDVKREAAHYGAQVVDVAGLRSDVAQIGLVIAPLDNERARFHAQRPAAS